MVIDFRLRPPLGAYLKMKFFTDLETTKRMAQGALMAPPRSVLERSMSLLLREMDEAGVTVGVVPARYAPDRGIIAGYGTMTNEELAMLLPQYGQRFAGLAAIDPTIRKKAVEELKQVKNWGFRGVVIEPGYLPHPLYLDDRRLYPLYAYCEDNQLPVLCMAGGNAGPDPTFSAPEHIDRVAADFPDLVLVSGHGNWPWVREIIHVAYRRPNLYLSPDIYLFMAGTMDYVDAVNSFLGDRFLYATAYPLLPPQETLQRFQVLPFKAELREKILYSNAAKILGLNINGGGNHGH